MGTEEPEQEKQNGDEEPENGEEEEETAGAHGPGDPIVDPATPEDIAAREEADAEAAPDEGE